MRSKQHNIHGMRLAIIAVLLFPLLLTNFVKASTNSNNWQKISEAKATWLWLDIYKAELYVDAAAELSEYTEKQLLADGVPLTLKLCYLVNLSSEQIIQAANEVLPDKIDNNKLATSVNELHNRYQNVTEGDCYSLQHHQNGSTQLILNKQILFHTKTLNFKELYFGIWLGNNPLSVDLKNQLLKFQSSVKLKVR